MLIGEEILRLRAEGLSYRQIEVRLGCSKGTISYHCGSGQKNKTLANTKKRRLCPLRTKMESFKYGKKKEFSNPLVEVFGLKKKVLSNKIAHFSRMGTKYKRMGYKFMFKLKDLIKKIGDDPRCYWTGRKINLNSRKSYHLDHFVPKSRGGDNSLENCVLACREANQGHSDSLPPEYINVSCEVAAHRGKEILAKMLARDKEFRELLLAELKVHRNCPVPQICP